MDMPQQQAMNKAQRRLLPFLFVLYVVAYLDRINISFAQLQMADELGFSDLVYGFGASVFFIGFILFEIPSNLILRKLGARAWIARIMVSWGLLSSAMAFIDTPLHFYLLRFALGAAEAGFFPGIILYLGDWFPDDRRAGVISSFMTATAAAGVIGAPLSGFLLTLHGGVGLDGWQWLFLLEGIPSIVLGISVWWVLPNTPKQAPWLTDRERSLILRGLQGEVKLSTRRHSLRNTLRSPEILRLGALYFSIILAFNSLSLWLPKWIKSNFALDNVSTALLSTLPFLAAAFAMIVNGRDSDRTSERRWHIVIPASLGALGLIGIVLAKGHPLLQFGCLCLASSGVWATLGPFWTLPFKIIHPDQRTVGVALINSIGAIGGFVGPNLMAISQTHFGSFDMAFLLLSGILLSGSYYVRSI